MYSMNIKYIVWIHTVGTRLIISDVRPYVCNLIRCNWFCKKNAGLYK